MPKKPKVADPKSAKSDNKAAQYYTGLLEKTYQDSAYVAETYLKPYNPDDLWQKKGNYDIYRTMLKDDQVDICLQLKKDLVLGGGGEISIQDESQQDIKEQLEKMLYEDPEIPFDENLEEVLTAYEFGFSLGEKLFKVREDGLLSWRCIKVRDPDSWLIHTDDQGNINKYEQRVRDNDLEIDPNSLMHYINRRRFQNPYGQSDLRPAYSAWFTKNQIIKYYAIFLEKAAAPTPIGKYPKNLSDEVVQKIYNAIKSIQTKTAMVVPNDVEIELMEAKSNGEAYVKGIAVFNMLIGRSLFIPDLVGVQGGETAGGAYALGKEQMSLFFKHIDRRRNALERLVNMHIIKPIVYWNWGDVEPCPKWKLKPISDEQAIELAKLWLDAVRGKVFKANDEEINHFRMLAQFPEGEVQHEEVVGIDPMTGMPIKKPMMGGGEDEKNPKGKPAKGEIPTKGGVGKEDLKEEFARKYPVPKHTKHHKKVDFRLIEAQLVQGTKMLSAKASPIVFEILEDLGEQIRKKSILKDAKPERADNLKFSERLKKKLIDIFDDMLIEHYEESKSIAQTELLKHKKQFAKSKVILSDDFIKILKQENYSAIGDWEYDLTKRTRARIIAAVKDGEPLSAVVNFDKDGFFTGMIEDMDTSIERYARTKFTEVMNKGRLEFFKESGEVVAYQYSAILDDRTSDICDGLHEKIFTPGDAPVPPLHFNCRSTLVPILKGEEYELTEEIDGQGVNEFIDENKGEGFPTK